MAHTAMAAPPAPPNTASHARQFIISEPTRPKSKLEKLEYAAIRMKKGDSFNRSRRPLQDVGNND
jgi:hypothetical protein